ncbi:hypothetical protein [Microbacterium caowuchunii]|nr:hypothetical protein [Microbacterium caowuchunii]
MSRADEPISEDMQPDPAAFEEVPGIDVVDGELVPREDPQD